MEMTSWFACFWEQKIKNRMDAFYGTTREGALRRLEVLSGDCVLTTNQLSSGNGQIHSGRYNCSSPTEVERLIRQSMRIWINPGFGPVYVSQGKTHEGRPRIVIKHHIPGGSFWGHDGVAYDFAHNNYYEVVQQ